MRADRRRIAARVDVFLEGERHAVERRQRAAAAPARLRGARLVERALRAHAIHGVDARLPGFDALEERARHFDRRQLAARVVRRELARAEFMNAGHRSEYILARCSGHWRFP